MGLPILNVTFFNHFYTVSDPIDEMGSRSSLSRDDMADLDNWEMNYHEAAIFLEVNKFSY